MPGSSVDALHFRKILSRNVALPLGLGLFSAVVFVGIVFYLLNILNWVEHSERVIGKAHNVNKLTVDMESGVRGYLIAGDEPFLIQYRLARPQITGELATLSNAVNDNNEQLDRLRRIQAAYQAWQVFADEVIALKRTRGDYIAAVRTERGKQQMDQIRSQFTDFIELEERLRQTRSDNAKSAATLLVSLYLVLSLGVAGVLALVGRRELKAISATYAESLKQQRAHNDLLERTAWLRSG